MNAISAFLPMLAVASTPNSIIRIILLLTAIGVIVWLVTTYIPMPDLMKRIILVVTAIGVILWLLQVFGLL